LFGPAFSEAFSVGAVILGGRVQISLSWKKVRDGLKGLAVKGPEGLNGLRGEGGVEKRLISSGSPALTTLDFLQDALTFPQNKERAVYAD
jgi:hypothetical protein